MNDKYKETFYTIFYGIERNKNSDKLKYCPLCDCKLPYHKGFCAVINNPIVWKQFKFFKKHYREPLVEYGKLHPPYMKEK